MKKNILKSFFSILFIIFLIVIMLYSNIHTTTDIDVINVNVDSKSQVSFVVKNHQEVDKLHFFSNAKQIKIYFNDELVESFSNIISADNKYTIELPDYEVNVVIESVEVSGLLIGITQVYIGTNEEIVHHLLIKDLLLILIILMMFFTSIVIILLTIYFFCFKHRSYLVTGYALFYFIASLWCVVQLDFIINLFDSNILYFIKNYSIFMFPISAAITSLTFNKTKLNKIVVFSMISIFILLPLIATLAGFFNVELLQIFNLVTILLTIVYFIGIILLTQIGAKDKKNKFSIIFIQSLIVCCIGLLLELLSILIPSVTGPGGMYFSICLLFVYIFSISRVVKEYVKKENYRTYLSEENARLSSSILLSQIKPHFLYNALNSISFLCKKDPKQADMAVIRFSRYLRQNMKCIESSDLVDFASEMEHIRNYVYLETIRFPKMEIVYELKYINFQVPPLCIQPIVENAVKHGVSKNTEGGYVIVKSFATAKHIIIEVSDNGPGFDTSVNMKGTGLSNISRRLKMLIEADIEFGSVIGKGTVVRVKIPREGVK